MHNFEPSVPGRDRRLPQYAALLNMILRIEEAFVLLKNSAYSPDNFTMLLQGWTGRTKRASRRRFNSEGLTAEDFHTLSPRQLQAKAQTSYQRMADTWDCVIYVYLFEEAQGDVRAHVTDTPLLGRVPFVRVCPYWLIRDECAAA